MYMHVRKVRLKHGLMCVGQVETDETENWNGKRKAETEKRKSGNGRHIAHAINRICACSNNNTR